MHATDSPAIADDTGLFVDALGGCPGVRSARFAGVDATDARNRAKLLRELSGEPNRRAEFRTVIVVCWPDGREIVAEGSIFGTIAPAERGERGFGYDTLFIPDGDGRTFAEMSPDEKNLLSHRGRALRALVDALAAR